MSINITTFMKSFDFKEVFTAKELCNIFKSDDIEDVLYYLNKYAQLGFINIKDKDGLYSISNTKDIEENIINFIKQNIDNLSYEEWLVFLELNWSDSARIKYIELFHSKFPDDDYKMSVFYEPYPLRVTSINPLEARDVYSYKLLSTIYDQLFYYDNGINKNLIQHYTMDEHVLKLYLKKSVKFHDGTILCADDVVNNLNALFEHPKFEFYRSNILSIERLSQHSLQIIMERCTPMILNILSSVQSSIYKKENHQFIGTGPFYLGHDYISHRELYAFDDYHQGRPYIDKIINLQVPIDFYRDDKYESYLDGTTKKTVEEVYSLVMMLFNTQCDNVKNPKIRAYITQIIQHHIKYLLNIDDNLFPNYNGFFQDSKTNEYTIPVKNQFQNHEIRVAIIDNFESIAETIAAILESYGFNVTRVYYKFSEFVKMDASSIEADLMIALYGLYSHPDYSFYGFLTTVAAPLIKDKPKVTQLINMFESAPTHDKHQVNLNIEEILIEQNIIVPILKNKRMITIPNNIIDYKIDNNGFVDYRSIII
ncbi:ABC transporter substrate-binding protein [Macrococcus sp. EM39E]|uniref:ABC transporter substrate-binding protein n=1 Tax=Macrococcus animalis TaxID=3395467 RepID=UPI0039BDE425